MKKTVKTCSRSHEFYKSSDCPVCPKCWPGYYEKHKSNFPNLAAPALRALLGANIHTLVDLSKHSKQELANLHGIGPNAMQTLQRAMKHNNISFKD